MSLHLELGRDSQTWLLQDGRSRLQETTGSDPGLSHCLPQAQEGTGALLARWIRVHLRISYPVLVPVGVKVTVIMVVAVAEIVVVMVEASVPTTNLFSVMRRRQSKKSLHPP